MTVEEKKELREELERRRNEFEAKNCGKYELLWPIKGETENQRFLEGATEIWEQFTGSRRQSKINTRDDQTLPNGYQKACWEDSLRKTSYASPAFSKKPPLKPTDTSIKQRVLDN